MGAAVPLQLLGQLLASPPLLSVPPHLLFLLSQPEDLAVEPQVTSWHCLGGAAEQPAPCRGGWEQGSHLFLPFHRPKSPLQPKSPLPPQQPVWLQVTPS